MSEQEAEIETLMHEATALYGAGRIGMAENAYKAVLKKQRNHPGALHLLGVITCQRGDKERGMRMIERALRVKSPFPDAYNSLATICLNTGDPERAIEMTGRALDQDAANVAALKIRARAQTRLKDIEGAVATYAEYRSDVFDALARLVERRDRGRWRSATAFAEAWLRREAFHQLLLRVACIQYEPEPDPSDFWGADGEPLHADAWSDDGNAGNLDAADAAAELHPQRLTRSRGCCIGGVRR